MSLPGWVVDTVDVDVPVTLMPPWANPAAIGNPQTPPPAPESVRLKCQDPGCAVRWFGEHGEPCWVCGTASTELILWEGF